MVFRSQGVLLWEMHHGCRAWAGMTQSQIIHAVAICGQRLTFARELSDSQAVMAFFHLADACLVGPVTCVLTASRKTPQLIRDMCAR